MLIFTELQGVVQSSPMFIGPDVPPHKNGRKMLYGKRSRPVTSNNYTGMYTSIHQLIRH